MSHNKKEQEDTTKNPLSKLKIDHNPILVAGRCPGKNCNRKPTHILYFLVGQNLDIKSMYAALCETHAEQKRIEFIDKHGRETHIEKIEDINNNVRNNSEKPKD